MKKFYILLLIFLIIPISSAGLIVTPNTITINKTIGSSAFSNIQILNTENFTFYNVSLETNSNFNTIKIDSIAPGQYYNVSVIANTNTAGSYSYRIKGFYISNLGTSNQQYFVNVTSSAMSLCDFTIIQGDTVTWQNNILDSITAIDASTGAPVEGGIISSGAQIIKVLPAGIFRYYFTRSNFQFLPMCTITVLNTTGLVNNPTYDSILNINLQTNYTSTTITNTILLNNYTMLFSDKQDGIFSITNTGSNTAYNINLTGQWLSFSNNNFNLNPGETKGIVYTISPVVRYSNETGKSYILNLTIVGNFNTNIIQIYVNLNYTDISGNGSLNDADYLLKVFCPQYPKSKLCNPDPDIVYKYINNASDIPVNVTLTQRTVDGIFAYMFSLGDEVKTTNNNFKQIAIDSADYQNKTTSALIDLKTSVSEQNTNQENSKTGILVTVILIISGLCVLITAGIVYYIKRQKEVLEVKRF